MEGGARWHSADMKAAIAKLVKMGTAATTASGTAATRVTSPTPAAADTPDAQQHTPPAISAVTTNPSGVWRQKLMLTPLG
jgi:hypothetical protein